MVGMFARSKAGHDKDSLYVIIEESEDFYLLCDGDKRKLSNPKKKNKKHIQPVIHISGELRDMCFMKQEFYDEGIKRALNLYRKEIECQKPM